MQIPRDFQDSGGRITKTWGQAHCAAEFKQLFKSRRDTLVEQTHKESIGYVLNFLIISSECQMIQWRDDYTFEGIAVVVT